MSTDTTRMSFADALKRLNIYDYGDRIFASNSRGELMHLGDYINMATELKGDLSWFRPLFIQCVTFAESEWTRPESCFQHMPQMMHDMMVILAANN